MAQQRDDNNDYLFEQASRHHVHGVHGGFTAASLGDIAGAVTDGLAVWSIEHQDSPTAYEGYTRESH